MTWSDVKEAVRYILDNPMRMPTPPKPLEPEDVERWSDEYRHKAAIAKGGLCTFCGRLREVCKAERS